MINGPGASGTVGTRTGVDAIRVSRRPHRCSSRTPVIGEFAQQGIEVAASATTAPLTLDNVVIRNTNVSGVTLATSAGEVVASFNNVRIDGTPLALLRGEQCARQHPRRKTSPTTRPGIRTSGVNNIINAENLMISFASTGITGSAGSDRATLEQRDHAEFDRAERQRRLAGLDVGQQPDRQHGRRRVHQ